MRTTLTLDDDVAAQLAQLRNRGGRSYKQVVNDVMRVGLDRLDREDDERASGGPYTYPVSLGRPRLPDVDDVSDALTHAESARLEALERRIRDEIGEFRGGDRLSRDEIHDRALR